MNKNSINILNLNLLVLLFFFISGFTIYWNSFTNPFHYDDERVIMSNENIRSLRNIPDLFTNPAMFTSSVRPGEGHFRPLVETSYALNYALGGLNPAGYHLVNLVFHIGSAFAVFLIVKTLPLQKGGWGDYFAALAAGIIFLAHPFNTEAINYITARSSVMSGFFYLLAFYCWVKYRVSCSADLYGRLGGQERGMNPRSTAFYLYVASLLAFIPGMLSKEIVVTLPFMLWLYDLYFLRGRGRLTQLRSYLPYVPYILIVVIPYLLIRKVSFGGMLPDFQRDLLTQILTEIPVLLKHWQMFLWPSSLTIFHHVEIFSGFWFFPVISSAVIMVVYLIVAALLFKFSSRVVSFFMLWFFIALLPTIVIPLSAILQENRGYLAIVSFSVLTGLLFGKILEKKGYRLFVPLIASLVLVYSVSSIQRNKMWKDEITLWSDAVQKSPDSFQAYTALGVAYRRAGMYNQAVDTTNKALAMSGDKNYVAHDNLGRIFMDMGRWDMAAKEFEKVVRDLPYFAVNHNDLGVAYFRNGKTDLAEKHYHEAIRLDNKYYRPHFNLGILYTAEGRYADAVTSYKLAISIFPGHLRSRLHLGMLLDDMNRKNEAIEYFMFVIDNASKGDEELVQEARRRLIEKGGKVNGEQQHREWQ